MAFVEVVEKSGKGHVTYDWPKPKAGGGTSEELYPKLSYVKKFEPLEFLVGSGINVDDAAVYHRSLHTAAIVVVATQLLLLTEILRRSITR